MAEKQNPGYIEQLREMRALRTQQLRGMNVDQRFYANLNANQRALVQANQKLAASFDSMSKTFVSSIRGLTSAVGGLASKGASAAGGVAGGAASLAGSITSGLGKVLPFAIAGLVAKMLVWDNLTGENKNRLTSGVARLFTNIFGDLPDMFKGVIQKIVNSVSAMDIKLPIVGTLMDKANSLFKLFSASIEIIKLKFEDMMEFFEGIKDPMKIFESGLKAIGGATLARLLLPATVSLITSVIGNRLLMRDIGNVLDSRLGGTVGGGGVVGGGKQSKRARKRAMAANVGSSTVKGGLAQAAKLGLRGASTGLLAAIPVFNILAASYTAFELYQIASELGFSDEDADELSNVEPDIQTEAVSYFGETPLSTKGQEVYNEALKQNESNKFQISRLGNTTADQATKKSLEQAIARNQQIIDRRDKRIKQFDMEDAAFNKKGVLDSEITNKFFEVWGFLKGSEKQFAIEKNIPILESENFVYFYGKDGQIVQRRKVEYLDEVRKLPVVEQMSREEFQNKLANVIKPPESGAAGYNAFVFSGDASKGSIRPPKNLTEMTGEEVLEYQARLKASTKAAGQGKINGVAYGTSAVGAYQIVRQNLTNDEGEGYYDKNPGEKNKLFDEEQQDKIYRSLISGAVDEYMRTGDKVAFEKYVVNTWEAFKPEGSDARKQLQALLNNPTFTEGAGDSSQKQSKEQRAARLKIATQMFDESLKDLSKSGDTTLATVGGESVVQKAKTQAEKTANSVKDYLSDIFGPANVKPGSPESTNIYDRFENQLRNQLGLDPLESLEPPSKKSDAPVSIQQIDNSVTVAGGGSSSPSTSTNVISQFGNYSQHTRFQSLAGGNPMA